ncbi:acetoacetyl-coenzyme A synthetase-like [Nerophis lumbriciformis]|uniref:acetoacetyl-coenzyme A synthetase-like n=1 Tax=Nerophis lumbriciformis TaxID=546530 RepID=UPI003BAB1E4A
MRQLGVTATRSYPELHRWSVDYPEEFWPSLWDYVEVVASRRWTEVVDDPDRMPGASWFRGARLNFAENLLRFQDDSEALVSWDETGRRRSLSYLELHREVTAAASALKDLGVEAGDRVAGFLPNIPEAVVAMLAATSLGALWSSCSPDFGVQGVLDRFGQIAPKVLFTADGYRWAGKPIDSLEKIAGIIQQLPSVTRLVVVPFAKEDPTLSGVPRATLYRDFLAGPNPDSSPRPLSFEQLPFDHPLYIMYSSGTTGLPKCMVHGAGGTLLQHLKELVLHTDLKRGDRIFYYSTCGWMMWNWLVSSLAVGATVVLYDGSPFPQRKEILFDMAQAEGLTHFGTSAKYIALAEKEGLAPIESHDLSTLRAILSTGSPLAPESYDYVYSRIKENLCLSSIAGGTDLISCFALGNPTAPVYRGELQVCGLGMKVEVFDPQGNALIGEKGELVCTRAFPSMPVGFWNDPDGERYRQAYFDVFPGIWRHGDWVELTERGGMIFHGRSDATLNPGGVRIGTAEIYRQVEQLEEIVESLVIGQQWQGDVRVVLFVRLRSGQVLGDSLVDRIRRHIRSNATPRHVPAKVIQVDDIPRTLSGKISELAVSNLVHHRPVKNADALANPQALELFRDLPQLAT